MFAFLHSCSLHRNRDWLFLANSVGEGGKCGGNFSNSGAAAASSAFRLKYLYNKVAAAL